MRDPGQGRHRLLILFILLAGGAAYVGNLDTYFLKDDLSIGMLTANGPTFDAGSWFSNLIWPTARTTDDIFRPLPPLTWALDWALFGPDPSGFHLLNLFSHLLNGVLLYWLVNRLTGFRNPLVGFFAGLFLVLYPLHGEAVIWLTQRFVVFCLSFSLLSLLAWDVWLTRRRRGAFVLAWVSVLFAMACRESGLTLPAPMLVLALWRGTAVRGSRPRRDALVAVAAGGVLIVSWFALRWAIFGRLVGGYAGWPSLQAYAADFHVFERLPATLFNMAVPANAAVVPAGTRPVLAAAVLCTSLLAAWGLLSSLWTSPGCRRFVLAMTAFALVSWLVTIWIAWVPDTLVNGRFGYQASAPLLALLSAGLVRPWRPGGRSRRPWGILAPSAFALLLAIVLQWNLRAYDGGGAQVRQLQEALLAASRSAPPGALLVVFDVPYDYRGCPTVDRYLGALVTPPLVRKRIPAYAFLAGTAETWGDGVEELGALRDLPGGRRRPLHFSRLVGDPPVLQPVFGAPEPALGVLPPELVTPEDGALVPASAATPLFGFRMPPGFDRFRILLEGPLGTQKLSVRIGINAERIADRVVWSPSHPDAERPLPDLWSGLAGGVAEGFLPLRWRVEALDADGRRVGVSASRRIVILAAP